MTRLQCSFILPSQLIDLLLIHTSLLCCTSRKFAQSPGLSGGMPYSPLNPLLLCELRSVRLSAQEVTQTAAMTAGSDLHRALELEVKRVVQVNA